MNNQKLVMAIAWYSKQEWEKLKSVVDDPSSLDDTYSDWRKQANSALADIRNGGQEVMKISVKIDDLLEWCAEQGLKPDGKARSQYAAHVSRLRHK